MHYVYILFSKKDRKLYTGCTNDLKKRLSQHNAKKVVSTMNRAPLTLIHYEGYLNEKDAFKREKWLKSGWGRNHLLKSLAETLKSFGG